jgi:protein-S-isoprenylcysteine O-methyltransferase Ste14
MKEASVDIEKYNVHKVLAHSYLLYFSFFLIGIWLDLIFNFKVFNNYLVMPLGVIFIILATFIIFWAQSTSRNLPKENITKETFCRGPYCYTRVPTHLGIFLLMIGFGMINNYIFVILLTLLSFLLSKFIFLNKEEKILVKKYGAPYLEYQKAVKF